MSRIRIGYVRYLNTLPLVEGLAAWRDAELVAAAPASLIDMLLDRRIDIGLVSIVDAARADADVAILPMGMIGCDGPTLTVRIFSRRPMSEIRVLHADAESHTSTILAQVLLRALHGVSPEIRPFTPVHGATALDGSPWPESVLLIGDKVLSDAPATEGHPFQLDLGQAWRELTGLSFVYAVWMCRAGEESSPSVQTAVAVLERQRLRNQVRTRWIVSRHSEAHGWPQKTARTYIEELLRYEFTAREAQSAGEFLRLAEDMGLVTGRRPRLALV